MIPVFQTITGPLGNCFAACVASMLEKPIEDVAHLFPTPGMEAQPDGVGENVELWCQHMQEGLKRFGLCMVEIPWQRHWPASGLPDGSLHILGCRSGRGIGHAVIGRVAYDGREMSFTLAHDPHPEGWADNAMENVQCVIMLCYMSACS
jgi:hypothetical protein